MRSISKSLGMGLIAAASFGCRGIQRYVKRPRFGSVIWPPKKNTGWIMDISIRKWELTSLMDFLFFLYVHLLFNSK